VIRSDRRCRGVIDFRGPTSGLCHNDPLAPSFNLSVFPDERIVSLIQEGLKDCNPASTAVPANASRGGGAPALDRFLSVRARECHVGDCGSVQVIDEGHLGDPKP